MTSPLFKSSPQPAVQPTAQPDRPKPGPQARSTVYAIRPYVGGAAKAKSGKTIKLSSNEAAFGPSPQAIAAGKAAAASLHRYPDGNAAALRNALQARYHYPAEQIVCGAGSDEIISLLCQAYLEPGDETLYSAHGFLMYRLSTLAAGGTPVAVPEKDLRVQVDAILDALSPRTKLVFVANPNNPTGSYLTKSELLRLHEALPDSVLLCIDEAYGEYASYDTAAPDYSAAGFLVAQGARNLVVTGTFSKLYGLGGLRVGWGYAAPGIIDVLNRIRGPFNVSSIGQAAAVAALEDRDWQEKGLAHNARLLREVGEGFERLGLTAYPSLGNFILVDLDSESRRKAVNADLAAQGILVREVAAYGLPSCLRVTIGTEPEMAACLEGFKTALQR